MKLPPFLILILILIPSPSLLPAQKPSSKKPNIVLITIDTLRPDRLGCYGYSSAQTPTLDRLAAEGILFTNAVSHVPLTRPSHATIFTGLNPYQHHIHDNVDAPLDKKFRTLAEILRKSGYVTAAFVSAFVINSQSGLDRGFDHYADHFDPQNQPTKFALNLEKRAGEVQEEFQKWLSGTKSRPYFAWLHFYDPHFPYEPPPPYANRFAKHPYDGEIAYVDEVIAKTIRLLDPNTILIVTSDHGESLGEHGENAHSFFIYDSTLRVPLLFRYPGILPAGRKVTIQTRLIDLFPTILDLLSIDSPVVSGSTVKAWMLDPSKPDPKFSSYCETYTPELHFGWSRLLGVRTADWKYVDAPRAELYQLRNDPGETRNLITSNTAKASEFKQWLARSEAMKGVQSNRQDLPVDPETMEKLASLGYAGISAPVHPPGTVLADPKDKIGDFKLFNQLIREGVEAFQQERYQEAASKFRQLRDRNIPSFEVHYYLGRALLRLKSFDKARTELELALHRLPHFLPAYKDLSEAWEGSGDRQKAEGALLAGLKISPNHPILVQPLAWFYQKQQKYDQAEKLLIAELKEHPNDFESRFRLGSIYRDTGRIDAAMAQFRQILAARPDDAEAHNQLGMLYGGRKQFEEAAKEFAQAVRLAPATKVYQKNLELAKASSSGSGQTIRFRLIQTKTRAAADVLLRKLQSGEDWEALARDYSIHPSARSGQSILELTSSEVDPLFLQALRKIQAGQMSAVIESSSGFFILRKE